jgi:hypothetical protein
LIKLIFIVVYIKKIKDETKEMDINEVEKSKSLDYN